MLSMVESDVYVFLALFSLFLRVGAGCLQEYLFYLFTSLPAFGGEVRGDSHVQRNCPIPQSSMFNTIYVE